MSKHSYRRLAIVAGTALAVGSMAPAMAAHVDAGSNGSATVDISGGTAPTVPTILPAGFLSSLTDTALVTAQSAPGMALSDVNTIAGDLLGIGGDILASGLPAVDVNAGANASSGGSAGGNGSVSVTIPTDVLGTATGAPGQVHVTVTTRDAAAYRDPAVLLIDQLKEIYIDGTLKTLDTTQWYPAVMRKDYAVGVTVSENGLDDPDQQFYENFACGAERNYTGYCSTEVDQMIDRQSSEADTGKRKQIVWEIERKLAEDAARPSLFFPMSAACWQPYFKGHTMMVNGNYNGWRFEDVWLDK